MTIFVHNEKPLNVATSSGSWTANTIPLIGLLQQIIIKPATSSTMYDFSLTNDRNEVIYSRTDFTGEISEESNLPINGIITMAISNATADEAFTIDLVVRER